MGAVEVVTLTVGTVTAVEPAEVSTAAELEVAGVGDRVGGIGVGGSVGRGGSAAEHITP